MAVEVNLAQREQSVEAGRSVAFAVEVRNTGASTETVRLSVSGTAAPFSWIAPDSLSVEPGGTATARVGFHMPAASLPAAGALPFEVTVAANGSEAAPAGALSAATGVVHLEPFSALSATLDPSEVSGKGSVQQELCLSNRGNAPVAVRLEAKGEGVDVRFTTPALTVSAEEPARSALEVSPRRKLLSGPDRTHSYTIVATPAFGAPAEAGGRFVQGAAFAARTLVGSGLVAAVLAVALVAAGGVFSKGSSSSKEAEAPATSAIRPGCPVDGHVDRFGVSGLSPDDIFQLPNTYSFFGVRSDGCTPVRFNPCEPVHYIQNAALAPPTGVADVQEAFRQLSAATGITFVDDGLTDETNRRRPYVPERYGQRWAPILVSWLHFGSQGNDPTIQVVGRGVGQKVDDVLVSGTLALNVDAVTDKEAGTPLEGGFGPPLGSGVGAIGPKAVTWGRVILHELAHVVGLGHTKDKGAIMYPETADQTSRPAAFRQPDLEGLKLLGREAGCLTTPPVPTS